MESSLYFFLAYLKSIFHIFSKMSILQCVYSVTITDRAPLCEKKRRLNSRVITGRNNVWQGNCIETMWLNWISQDPPCSWPMF